MRYARVMFVLCLLATTAFAAPPKFSGEMWGGSEVIPNAGPVNVYWVFDGGVFHEYIYYYATDELRLMASGRYTACDTTYTLNLKLPQMRMMQVALTKENGSLTFPHGERLSRVEAFTQSVLPVQHPAATSVKLKPATNLYASCCDDCYAVHDFLGISWLNGICCLGGCGPEFQGGGGSGGGGGASGGW